MIGAPMPVRGGGALRTQSVFPPRPAALWAVLLVLALSAKAQVFHPQAGSSSLYRAHGGSLGVQGASYEGGVGFGWLDQFRFGAFLKTRARGQTFSLGDDTIRFVMPTDIFNQSHYFLARGLSLAGERHKVRYFGFAGTTSTGFAAPFFRAARRDTWTGVLFLEAPLTPTVRAFSRNIFSDRQTSIHGLEWQPREKVRAALSGGIGANRGYFASSLLAEKGWVTIKASYARAANDFRRIIVQSPINSETDRENILVTLRPSQRFSLSAGRQNILSPSLRGEPGARAAVNHIQGALNVAGFRLGTSFHDSRFQGRQSLGWSYSLGRNLGSDLSFQGSVFDSRPARSPRTRTWLASVRETLSPRLKLLQLLTHSNGRTTVSFGGNFLTNLITIGVDYQTVFVPFAPGNQFKQAIVLNVGLRPFGNHQLDASTFVAPDGRVRYMLHGSTFLYGPHMGGGSRPTFRLLKNVVRGRVVDEQGEPVRGAALRIDKDVVYTNSQGQFFLREKKARSYRLEVLVEEFLVPGRFEVVSAPATVTAAREDTATEITIVVRHAQPPSR